jgi:geranylgeranyl reductase family protein
MTKQPEYDVAVIGAGPAGSRTAAALSAKGLQVALLEKEATPGNPVHCTGIVSTECFENYELPSSLVLRSVSSFVLFSPSGRGAQVRRNRTQAHVVDRVAMDQLMVTRAELAGAELISSFDAQDVRWNGRTVTISGRHHGSPAALDARAAVVATGFGSKLPRRAGFGSPRDYLSGCQAVVEANDLDELEVFTGAPFGKGGFGWLVPWKPGLALAGLMARRETMHYLGAHIERLHDSGRIGAVRELYRCRAIPLGMTQRSVVDGILGVGDAVGQVKPTSGGGIYFGLLGAEEAARTLSSALERDDVSAASLEPYERRWRAFLASEIDQGYALRRLIEQLPDSVVENIHRLLSVPGLRRLLAAAGPSFDWHSGPLTSILARLRRHTESAQPATP